MEAFLSSWVPRTSSFGPVPFSTGASLPLRNVTQLFSAGNGTTSLMDILKCGVMVLVLPVTDGRVLFSE